MKRGLTLIELMVVCGITLALTAISVTVYLQASHRSKESVCITNLQSIGRALHLYAAENGDLAPHYVTYTLVPQGPPPTAIPAEHEKLIESLEQFGAARSLWRCPLEKAATQGLANVSLEPLHKKYRFASYENTRTIFFAPREGGLMRLSLSGVEKPAEFDYLADIAFAVTVDGADSVRTAHGSAGNFLFLDGHVKSKKWDPATIP